MRISNVDAYALRSAVGRKPLPDNIEISPLVRSILSVHDASTPDGWNAIQQIIAADPDIQAQVLAVDLSKPPTVGRIDRVPVPALPKAAQLTDDALKQAESVGDWYKATVAWAAERSPMTPRNFLESGVLWTIGLAVARRAYIEVHERIYPHLYLLIVAETSRYAKSTGMNTIYQLVTEVMPYMLIPGQTSPEGMIEILSGEMPTNFDKLPASTKDLLQSGRVFSAQRGILMDEYSGILAMTKKEYMAGFVELLMRLYDARERESYYTRSGGYLEIKWPALNIFGATTPAALARVLTAEDWENGANARYLIQFRDDALPYNPNYAKVTPPAEIVNSLRKLHRILPDMRDEAGQETASYQALASQMTKPVFDAYQAYSKAMRHDLTNDDLDERLHGNYSRMHVQALKMALALACMDWAEQGTIRPIINLGHWAIAQQVAETARDSLHRLMPVLSETRDVKTQRDLITILKQNPGGVTVRDLCRLIGKSAKDIRNSIEVLTESGECEAFSHQPGTGRPTTLYRLSSV